MVVCVATFAVNLPDASTVICCWLGRVLSQSRSGLTESSGDGALHSTMATTPGLNPDPMMVTGSPAVATAVATFSSGCEPELVVSTVLAPVDGVAELDDG